ncbi:mycoredoxin [Sphaerisporangium fuscum]|uniref:mycoredoxin n=1 Tax=Sphaerisporangium fuscum TaxID=2835868 RepID=UPI001BDCD806|nr:mycoredoxin [Sphaerisporangium fuscum]
MALKVYTTSWCGPCKRLKGQLTREGISYEEIDIETDPAAAEFVMSVNGGNQTVPTVVLQDGRTLTNPSVLQLKGLLAASS